MKTTNIQTKNIEIKRFNPNVKEGLSTKQVERRKEQGLINYDTALPTKSIKTIIIENLCTLFNLINLLLGIAIFCVGSYKNLFFLLIIITNTLISTIQEIKSKKTIDKLAIISSKKANVIRNGKIEQIAIDEIVLDDLIEFNTGNQIATDCEILDGQVDVDESFITGEPSVISKQIGDKILSGSFIVSGKCIAKVEHIGMDNYTYEISSGAKYVKKVNSEIMNSLNKIVKIVSIVIIPLGIVLFMHQMQIDSNYLQKAVVNTVAAIINMIPEGLVLLTSTVLAVSVVRLSKYKVLVQELYCIETLARVDTLCLDKTGTITEGKMEVKDLVPLNSTMENMQNILSAIGKYSEDTNSTIDAIRENCRNNVEWKAIDKVAFSSIKKWSGITFEKEGTYIIGAPEFVLKNEFEIYKQTIEKYSEDYRVVLLAHSKERFNEKELPENIEVIGLILILDKIRDEAPKTLNYFKEQGVDIKIISGDNPKTVSKIAKHAGVENYNNYIDMTNLTDDKIEEVANTYTIFGRVSPTQKKALVVALKKAGHTVAMTGDGVNDVLALKEADCSIAMASGSDAARSVSQLVLLDSNFKSMPKVVAEGRKTINNIERSATLFLAKTIYATILALLFLFMPMPYPFMPIQLSLISIVTIGIPSFILALEPNKDRIKGKFFTNVITKAIPTSLTVVIGIISIMIISGINNLSISEYSTLCILSTGITGLMLLFKLCFPFNWYRGTLFISMIILFVFGITVLKEWFSIIIVQTMTPYIIINLAIIIPIYIILNIIYKKIKG